MTIKKLIEELSKCENQDAEIHIVLGNDDDDIFDTTDFEVFSDHSYDDYQDLFIHVDSLPDLKQIIDNDDETRNPIIHN